MRHDGETRQSRRVKFLKYHPVADDVLDIVRHHREHKGDELGAEARVAHRRKGPLRGWRRVDGDRFRITHKATINLLCRCSATLSRFAGSWKIVRRTFAHTGGKMPPHDCGPEIGNVRKPQLRSIATAAASSAAAITRTCCSVSGPRASRKRRANFRFSLARMISGAGPPPCAALTDCMRANA